MSKHIPPPYPIDDFDKLRASHTALLEAATDAVGLIRGSYPMVNASYLLQKLEKAIAQAEAV